MAHLACTASGRRAGGGVLLPVCHRAHQAPRTTKTSGAGQRALSEEAEADCLFLRLVGHGTGAAPPHDARPASSPAQPGLLKHGCCHVSHTLTAVRRNWRPRASIPVIAPRETPPGSLTPRPMPIAQTNTFADPGLVAIPSCTPSPRPDRHRRSTRHSVLGDHAFASTFGAAHSLRRAGVCARLVLRADGTPVHLPRVQPEPHLDRARGPDPGGGRATRSSYCSSPPGRGAAVDVCWRPTPRRRARARGPSSAMSSRAAARVGRVGFESIPSRYGANRSISLWRRAPVGPRQTSCTTLIIIVARRAATGIRSACRRRLSPMAWDSGPTRTFHCTSSYGRCFLRRRGCRGHDAWRGRSAVAGTARVGAGSGILADPLVSFFTDAPG